MTNKVLEAIDGIADAQDVFIKRSDAKIDGIVERVESLESLGDRPPRSSNYSRDDHEHKDKSEFIYFVYGSVPDEDHRS